ncbi:hypothetical protein KPZU09_15440 [Klebsiella pneumoniae]|uniref:Four-carbon acid sugar kinase nucleotide binding domain-containing protein n=1 Tax=Klebsiella pneumoniae TaxID=573 RepID=A0A919LQN0_KLEPN|nr:hypothetical protein KPZU09_15440 [Klebsiella pneumoniae]
MAPGVRSGRHAAGRPGGGALGLLLGDDQQPVAAYRQQAPARAVDLSACFTDLESYVRTLTDWVDAQRDAPLAPMIYATTEPQTLQRIRAQYGDKASSERVEQLFAALAAALKAKGFTRFIVAGGETSSIVAQTTGLRRSILGRPSPRRATGA